MGQTIRPGEITRFRRTYDGSTHPAEDGLRPRRVDQSPALYGSRYAVRLVWSQARWLAALVVILATPLRVAGGQDVQCGPWHVIGPFRDSDFGMLPESLEFPFAPETDALNNNGIPLLEKAYRARELPGILNAERRWESREDWIDGYRVLLPRGPAPSRNETVYLYRKITVAEAGGYTFNILAADAAKLWVDGESAGRCLVHDSTTHKFSRLPVELTAVVQLAAGAHHVLVKSTSRFSTHSFAFAMPPFVESYQPGLEVPPKPVLNENPALKKHAYTDEEAWARVRDFRFAVRMPRMYAPPRSVLDEKLAAVATTPAADAYGRQLAALRNVVQKASASGDPARIRTASQAIDRFWSVRIGQLPRIVFLRTTLKHENAVVPLDRRKARGPGEICVWDPRRPRQGPRVLFGPSTILDMNVSRDGRRVLFSAADVPQAREGSQGYCLFSLNIDPPRQRERTGRDLKQVTEGHSAGGDISPCELPSGDVMFVSTRSNTHVICQPGPAHALFVCDADGNDIRKVSGNVDTDHYPQVLNDGRILFTRWDYGVEKNVFTRHALWTMNPDGSNLALYFGNAVMSPNAFWKARPVPGRPEIVCVFGAHHRNQAGMLGLVSNHAGTEAPRGIGFRYITTERPVQGDQSSYRDYRDPFPIHERQFLAAQGTSLPTGIGLWLLDSYGNRKCLYAPGGDLCSIYPLLVEPAPEAPVIPPRSRNPGYAHVFNPDPETETAWERDAQQWATLMVQDVYRGISKYVGRGEAKHIQVVEQVFRPPNTNTEGTRGIVVLPSNGTAHVRRIIGTVPVDEDGSAVFKAPPLRSISFNLLDRHGKLLMRMGSDIHVMPGERRSCLGCHEVREHTALTPSIDRRVARASRGPPSIPRRPEWTADGLIDYPRHIQPIFDRYCIECHSGANPDAYLDLSGDRTRFFSVSYDNLLTRELVDWHSVAGGDSGENTPKAIGSYVSKLCQYVDTSDHAQQTIPLEERRRIYGWIDANVPYYSTYTNHPERKGGHDAWYFGDHFERSFENRCVACHRRRIFNQSMNGGWATVFSSRWSARAITANNIQGNCPLSVRYGPDNRINVTNPEHSAFLLAPLAKEAGGWGLCTPNGGRPVFADRNDPDYRIFLTDLELSKEKLIQDGQPLSLSEIEKLFLGCP